MKSPRSRRPLVHRRFSLLGEAGETPHVPRIRYHSATTQRRTRARIHPARAMPRKYQVRTSAARAKAGLGKGIVRHRCALSGPFLPNVREPRVEKPLMLALSLAGRA